MFAVLQRVAGGWAGHVLRCARLSLFGPLLGGVARVPRKGRGGLDLKAAGLSGRQPDRVVRQGFGVFGSRLPLGRLPCSLQPLISGRQPLISRLNGRRLASPASIR